MCGLKRRSVFPEFQSFVAEHDILFVCETKLDSTDVITVPNFTFFSKPRKQRYQRKSGGLGCFVRNDILKHVSVIETDSDYVFWVKVCKSLLVTNYDILFGITYVPPLSSRFYNNDEFELFEYEITNMCSKYEYLYLCGDFNAQVGELSDVMSCDNVLFQNAYDDELNRYIDQEQNFEANGISLSRKSIDKKKNNHGYRLIDLCKNNNLAIVNGRYNGSLTSKYTFRDTSVIDYYIASVKAYKLISHFEIRSLDTLFSDEHSVLKCNINSKQTQQRTQGKHTRNTNKCSHWVTSEQDTFAQNINTTQIENMLHAMTDNVNQTQIDSLSNLQSDKEFLAVTSQNVYIYIQMRL